MTKSQLIDRCVGKPSERREDGTFASDSELQATNLTEAGHQGTRDKASRKRKTERSFLEAIIDEFGMDDFRAIAHSVRERAKDGDKDALAWVGKYLLGGGRVSLDELAWAPMIRRGKR